MKYLFSFVLLILMVLACGSRTGEPQNNTSPKTNTGLENPHISIQVDGFGAGPVYLIGFFADSQYRVDSTSMDANGKVVFQNNSPYKPGFYMAYFDNDSTLQLLVDKDQTFSMKSRANDLVNGMIVEGSLDNELLYETLKYEMDHQRKIQPITSRLKAIEETDLNYAYLKTQQEKIQQERRTYLDEVFSKNPNTFFTKFKRAGQNPIVSDIRRLDGTLDNATKVHRFRTQFWDNVDFSDERLLYTPVIANKLKRYMTRLTPQHADSINKTANHLVGKVLKYPEYFKFFANWITLNYEPSKTTLMDSEAVYVNMIQNYFTHDRAFWSDSTLIDALQRRAGEMAASLVGKKGPDVVSTDVNGKTRSILELKAPYIVVFMYNPTCDHCIEETPKLIAFYEEWKDRGVDVFGIAIDTDDAEWRDYVAKSGMPWINVFDPTNRSIYGKYYVDITPEIYVLDPDRTIIAKNLQVHQIAEVINKDRTKREE